MGKETIKDPVCQMDIDPAKAIKITHEGKDYYFCNTNCQWAFENNPKQFIQQ